MRKYIITFIFFICLFFNFNANAYDVRHNWYMNFVSNIPQKYEKNIQSLVSYLTHPMQNDYDKAQAFAYWIASHIVYDQYLYNNGQTTKLRKQYSGQTPKELLQSKVGICADFANLFNTMCSYAGIKSGYVDGYTFDKNENIHNRKNRLNNAHRWNYFIYKNSKIYVDTTWMATGKLNATKMVSKFNRKTAIKKHNRQNKISNKIYPVNPYYFDFSYKSEYKDNGVKRIEEN